MDYITGWITEIILLILLAVVLEMLLPNSNMQRYVRMVVGLLLLLALLSPVLSIFNTDVEKVFFAAESSSTVTEKAMGKSIKNKKSEIQASQRAYIEDKVVVYMKNKVKGEIHERFNLEVTGIEVALSGEETAPSQLDPSQLKVEKVSVQLAESNQEKSVEPITPVTINTTKQNKQKAADNEVDYPEILSFLAAKWELPKDKITVGLEGGDVRSDES